MSAPAARERRRVLLGKAAGLLVPGVATAGGLAAIAGGLWQPIARDTATFLLLFLQWQLLGQTLARLGAEMLVFSIATEERELSFAAAGFAKTRSLPIAVAVAIVYGAIFRDAAAAVALGVSVALDAIAVVLAAELAGKQQIRDAAVGNLLNFPLFFALLAAASLASQPTWEAVLGLFVVTSIARFLWCSWRHFATRAAERFRAKSDLAIGAQQALTLVLYRSDQLALSLFGAIVGAHVLANDFITAFLFLARFPEIVAGVSVALGPLYLPHCYVESSERLAQLLREPRVAAGAGLGVLCLCLALLVYRLIWAGPSGLPLWYGVPFLLVAVLILPTYIITYSMLRAGFVRQLLVRQICAIAIGLAVVAWWLASGIESTLLWVVPAQLATFVVLAVCLRWRDPRPAYVRL